MNPTHKYDVVLSFAGENRAIVEEVRDHLRDQNVRVFYDYDQQYDLLGKDLAEHFAELYQNAAQFCVIFVSRAYLEKAWCKWERQAALARALTSRQEYIIPYVLDDVAIPGIPETIGRAHFNKVPPSAFANLIVRKLKGGLSSAGTDRTRSITNQLIKSLSNDSDFGSGVELQRPPKRISTTFGELDRLWGAQLRSGAIYGIGSRPQTGKTAFALNMATRLSKQGIPVAYVTIDQPARTVIERLLALKAGVDAARVRGGYLNASESARIAEANASLSTLPLRIIDTGDFASLDVMLCELWKDIFEFKSRVFIIDSLDPIIATDLFGQGSRQSRAGVVTSLRWLAQETRTTAIVCLGLGYAVDARADQTPVITDIRGGKRVSRLFENVFLLYSTWRFSPSHETDQTLDVFIGYPDRTRRLGPAKLWFQRDIGLIRSDDEWENELDFDAGLEMIGEIDYSD